MSGNSPHVLIVGGDSRIGRAAANRLRANGWRVSGTTRRIGGMGSIELSMEKVAKSGPLSLEQYDAIVLAAAVTAQAVCESDPESAYLVNVAGPKVLARAAMNVGTHVVFLSTNLVLGGDQPLLGIAAPLAPVGAYGRMKAEAERSLQALPGAAKHLAVLRMTKVLDPTLPLLETWGKLGADSKTVTAFTDLFIAPVSLSFAAYMLARIVQTKAAGLFHCSGSDEVSYADFARAYLEWLGLDPALVLSVEGRPIDPVAAAMPYHASLAHDDGNRRAGYPASTIRCDARRPWGMARRDFLLLHGPYVNMYRGEDRHLWSRMSAIGAYIPLDHVDFITRLPKPTKVRYTKMVWDTLDHMRNDFRSGLTLGKCFYYEFHKAAERSFKYQLFRYLLLIPSWLVSRFDEPIPQEGTIGSPAAFGAYREKTRGTYPELMRRYGGDPDLSFLRSAAREIFSQSGSVWPN